LTAIGFYKGSFSFFVDSLVRRQTSFGSIDQNIIRTATEGNGHLLTSVA
jgi:hypothetical protein